MIPNIWDIKRSQLNAICLLIGGSEERGRNNVKKEQHFKKSAFIVKIIDVQAWDWNYCRRNVHGHLHTHISNDLLFKEHNSALWTDAVGSMIEPDVSHQRWTQMPENRFVYLVYLRQLQNKILWISFRYIFFI